MLYSGGKVNFEGEVVLFCVGMSSLVRVDRFLHLRTCNRARLVIRLESDDSVVMSALMRKNPSENDWPIIISFHRRKFKDASLNELQVFTDA